MVLSGYASEDIGAFALCEYLSGPVRHLHREIFYPVSFGAYGSSIILGCGFIGSIYGAAAENGGAGAGAGRMIFAGKCFGRADNFKKAVKNAKEVTGYDQKDKVLFFGGSDIYEAVGTVVFGISD